MLNSHPIVGAILASMACIAALAAADIHATETYVGANLASRGSTRSSCSGGTSCESPGSISGKVTGGYLADLPPVHGIQSAWGLEVMAYSLGPGKALLPSTSGPRPGSVKNKGVGITHVLQASFGDTTLAARAGLAYSLGRIDYAAGTSSSRNVVVPLLGLGVHYSLSRNWGLNADWDRLPAKYKDAPKITVNMFSIGVSYKF